MTVYAGVDLSWTGRYDSGLCIVEETAGGLGAINVSARTLTTDELCRLLIGFNGPVIAAIDAPLVVGAKRQAERLIGRAFGKYKASAHSANADTLRRRGMMAGPELTEALVHQNFTLDPATPIGRATNLHRLGGLPARSPYPAIQPPRADSVQDQKGPSGRFSQGAAPRVSESSEGLVGETMARIPWVSRGRRLASP